MSDTPAIAAPSLAELETVVTTALPVLLKLLGKADPKLGAALSLAEPLLEVGLEVEREIFAKLQAQGHDVDPVRQSFWDKIGKLHALANTQPAAAA